jgi:tRNA threonylcarbamoyl adenosine modification protein YeaZ
MKILALEFSSSHRSVAVIQPWPSQGPASQSEVIEVGGRATQAFAMAERALSEARVQREQIECIAVGLGPGSYTGIRAAIALAQGWQLACDIKVLGIGVVEVLAAQAQQDGIRGPAHFVVDAQRGEFYCSTWDLGDAVNVEVSPLSIASKAVLEEHLSRGAPVFGPDLGPTWAGVCPLYPSARMLGRLAVDRKGFIAGNELQPVYLREPAFVKAPPPRAA